MSIIETKIVMAGIFPNLFASGFINLIQGEPWKGADVFRLTKTIFGVEKSVGDLVAIVAVNNGQDSKVKLLDLEGSYVIPVNTTGADGLIEYVAPFPNVTVTAGSEYKACVLSTRDIKPICETGTNSPA